MKSIKHRLLSLLLTLVTALSLLPTAAFAASNTVPASKLPPTRHIGAHACLPTEPRTATALRWWTVSSCTVWIAASAIITQRLRT